MSQAHLLLSITLIFTGVMEMGLAIVVIALFTKVQKAGSIENRIDVLEQAYRTLRGQKANAARQPPTKFPSTPFPNINAALDDLTPEERSMFQ